MTVYELGETLLLTNLEDLLVNGKDGVFLVNSYEAKDILEKLNIGYEGEIDLENIEFCKMETQQECLWGTLNIPRLLDVLGMRYKLQFFVNKNHIVIVDDVDFSQRIVKRIQKHKSKQGPTKEKFICNFMAEFMKRDLDLLLGYEKFLMDIEEHVASGKVNELSPELIEIRKKLLTLHSYYDEMTDLGHDLEENENGYFSKKHLKYFGTISDRADRLMGKTSHLLEYARQIKESYQAAIDAKQNSNMQFLTIISTVFYPLTLVTGWYGMNFKNMPELEYGYPGVICLSIIIIIVILFVFKKKKIL